MKTVTFLVLCASLVCLAGNTAAVSPMPIEELRPGQTAVVCPVLISYEPNREKSAPGETYSKTFFFEVSAHRSEVLEAVALALNERLERGIVSKVKIECVFPK